MQSPPSSDPDLESLAAADRVARAAWLWIRGESAGAPSIRPGSLEQRELAAGMVSRLCELLELNRTKTLLAGYALALLQSEFDLPMDIPRRIAARDGHSRYFSAGSAAAERLFAALAVKPVGSAPVTRRAGVKKP